MFGFFKKSKGSAVDGFAKRRPIATTMLCLGALGLSLGGLTTGIVLGAKGSNKSFTDDYGNATVIDEIWNGSSFDKDNLQKLFDTISGQSNVGFGTLRSMANAARTDDAAICLKVGTTAATMIENNSGFEIVVTMGDLDWTPTYLSTDNQGNTILTLWLTNSSQLSSKNITSSTTFDANGRSTWSSGWYKDAPEYTYPSNMYGTSYIRTVTLNNGGKYSKSDSSSPSSDADVYTETATQDSASVFAKFTMKSVSDLPDYIVAPKDVQWQEYGQNAVSQLGDSYSCPNENWSDQIPDRGTYEGTTYKFSSYHDAYYNYAGKGDYNYAWRDDKIWLPSLTETGCSDTKIGLWNTSTTQRQNSTYSWLRSGHRNGASRAYRLYASGSEADSYYVNGSHGVRPALNLNLNSAALSAAIEVPPLTWIDYAEANFENGSEVDGSSEETAYEIATAEQLALLAKRVNDPSTHDDYASLYYKQTADIRLGGHDWQPIGKDDATAFSGHYNGNGYKIEGITINSTDSNANIGLFGYVEYASIGNVIMNGGDIRGVANDAGSIAGVIDASQIISCNSNINMTIQGQTGGITGEARGSEPLISRCCFSGNINVSNGGSGGIAAELLDGEINNCIFDGAISAKNNVHGYAGGVLGYAEDGDQTVFNCISKGAIYALNLEYVGGFCGYGGYGFSISNCAAYGYIYTDNPDNTGALLGTAEVATIISCSFSGTCNSDDIKPFIAYDYDDSSQITASYVWLNNDIKVYSDDTSNWAEHYGLAGSMNDGLPMQRSLFAIASVSPATTEEILAAFPADKGWKKYTAA